MFISLIFHIKALHALSMALWRLRVALAVRPIAIGVVLAGRDFVGTTSHIRPIRATRYNPFSGPIPPGVLWYASIATETTEEATT